MARQLIFWFFFPSYSWVESFLLENWLTSKRNWLSSSNNIWYSSHTHSFAMLLDNDDQISTHWIWRGSCFDGPTALSTW